MTFFCTTKPCQQLEDLIGPQLLALITLTITLLLGILEIFGSFFKLVQKVWAILNPNFSEPIHLAREPLKVFFFEPFNGYAHFFHH